MQIITVFRIENDRGQGPYHWGYQLMWGDLKQNIKTLPTDDSLIQQELRKRKEDISKYVFGFSSLEQLKEWFSESELLNLNSIGFKVSNYQVQENNIIHGINQILFKK